MKILVCLVNQVVTSLIDYGRDKEYIASRHTLIGKLTVSTRKRALCGKS